MDKHERVIRPCPKCGKDVDFTQNPFRPFCSKRCKMADLGSWLKEEYYISSSIFEIELEQKTEQQAEKNG